eukprot:TRINITY_DN25651_c0_g1_i1.p1 TRINITY_DN25651_c0_g1~~TRINITY_DN25651_c0_g1_i1.p1  ORF type:complete len:247 (-),score=40.48 TRINITY_DN25651_c0_g1_i1:66-806(-)
MTRRPPRSTQGVSSAASDVYKRQYQRRVHGDIKAEQYPNAIEKYNKALAAFNFLLGHGFLDIAEQVVRFVEEIEKPIHLNLSYAYLKLQRFESVVFHCEKVLELDPDNCKALYRMGMANLSNGQYRQAELCVLRVLAREPKNPDALALKEKINIEKQQYLKEIRKSKQSDSSELLPSVHFHIFRGVSLLLFSLIKFILNYLLSVFCDLCSFIFSFFMSFWIIRFPFNLFVRVPYGILKDILRAIFS